MTDNLPEKRVETVTGEVMGGPVEFIKELDDFSGKACLVKQGDSYFVVSSTVAPFSGSETLVFRCDSEGRIGSVSSGGWAEVAGGRAMSREEAIKQLETFGPFDD
jgi:hypothetical protein